MMPLSILGDPMILEELLRDPVIVNPVRLAILLYLFHRNWVLVSELVKVLEVTPGNLDSHLRTLKKEELVEMKRVFRERPRVMVRITDKGVERTRNLLKLLREFSF